LGSLTQKRILLIEDVFFRKRGTPPFGVKWKGGTNLLKSKATK
jgi:hypothetical protein